MSGLRDYSVVYFGNDWFAENRTSSHHIARRLGKIVPVLYIETPGSRSPQTSARDVRKLWRKLARALAPPQKVGEQFYVATIPQIPFRKLPMIDRLNRWLGAYLARRAMRKIGFGRRISWFVARLGGKVLQQILSRLQRHTLHPLIDRRGGFIQHRRQGGDIFLAQRAAVKSGQVL